MSADALRSIDGTRARRRPSNDGATREEAERHAAGDEGPSTEKVGKMTRRRQSASPAAGDRRHKAGGNRTSNVVEIAGATHQTELNGEYKRIHQLADLGAHESQEVRSRLGEEQSGMRATLSVDERGLLLVNGCAAFQSYGGPRAGSNWYLFVYNRDRWIVGPVLGANDARLTAHDTCSLPSSIRSSWLEWTGAKWDVSQSIVCRPCPHSERAQRRGETHDIEAVEPTSGFSYNGRLPLAAQSARRFNSTGSRARFADDEDDSESSLSLKT